MARRDVPGRRAPTSEPDWLTLGQAAKYLGVAQSTIRKWSDQGRVPAFYTPGGHRRSRRADLESFLNRSGPGGAAQQGPLVLIVDDDPRVREYVRVNLEMEGYAVREASSAEEGLAVLEEVSPDLVLLDVMMPEVDGWEMLRRLQERHGVGAIPVVMFSGKVEEQAAAEAAALAIWWRRPWLFLQVALADFAGQLISYGLKQWIGRERPPEVYASPRPLVHVPHDGSFPSGHATSSFACATILSFYAPRAAPAFLLLAAAIAWSRVYVGVHFPLDVLGGAVLGVLIAIALRWLAVDLRRSRRAKPAG